MGIDAGSTRASVRAVADDADARAFTLWIGPHWDVLYRLAVRMCGPVDGDDVLQESLAASWRKRHQFDPDRGTARAWLVTIVVDQARKHLSRRRRHAESQLEEVAADDPDDRTVAFDVTRALRGLTERQRVIVSLYYYADLPVVEVASAMSCSAGTVKSTLFDARNRLQELLGDRYR
ncbi:MAG: RNA polymerase sigma factor [Jatrophihabitantaceae bacterium]